MSAIVNLQTVWLNDAEDPSDAIELTGARTLTRTPEVAGRVQRVAGGVRRLIRRKGIARTWEVELPWATRAEVEWLEAHLGRTVTARDHRSHKVHGVYLSLPVDENGVTTRGGMALELLEVTHSEAV